MTDQAATLSEHERWLVRHCGPLQGDYQDLYARVSAFIHANDRYPSTTDPSSGEQYPNEHAERLLACRVDSLKSSRHSGTPAVRQLFELLPRWSWTPSKSLADIDE
jgi:hypothetical protein